MINIFAVLIIFISSFVGATGTLVIKKAINRHNFRKLFFGADLWLGLFLYGIATLFYLLVLNMEQLSIVYPLVSLTYLWTTIFSVKYLGEKMNKWKYFALVAIILGIILIGVGS
jgi:drug/metabolite transporter (DMT)-like permease